MHEDALRRLLTLWVAAGLAAASAALGVLVTHARAEGLTVALVPVAFVAIGWLIASNRAFLIFAAFGLCLLAPLPVTDPLPVHVGIQVYPSDLLVLLALVSWAAAWLLNPETARPSLPRTQVLGWPLLLFAVALLAAIIRGHERYGESLFSLPLRFVVYAGIAFAISDLKLSDAYRWIVAVFYAGTVWQAGVAIYGYATGTSATNQIILSTGRRARPRRQHGDVHGGRAPTRPAESRDRALRPKHGSTSIDGRARDVCARQHLPTDHLRRGKHSRAAFATRVSSHRNANGGVPAAACPVCRARSAARPEGGPLVVADLRRPGDGEPEHGRERQMALGGELSCLGAGSRVSADGSRIWATGDVRVERHPLQRRTGSTQSVPISLGGRRFAPLRELRAATDRLPARGISPGSGPRRPKDAISSSGSSRSGLCSW